MSSLQDQLLEISGDEIKVRTASTLPGGSTQYCFQNLVNGPRVNALERTLNMDALLRILDVHSYLTSCYMECCM